jgi:hypothetical protein
MNSHGQKSIGYSAGRVVAVGIVLDEVLVGAGMTLPHVSTMFAGWTEDQGPRAVHSVSGWQSLHRADIGAEAGRLPW